MYCMCTDQLWPYFTLNAFPCSEGIPWRIPWLCIKPSPKSQMAFWQDYYWQWRQIHLQHVCLFQKEQTASPSVTEVSTVIKLSPAGCSFTWKILPYRWLSVTFCCWHGGCSPAVIATSSRVSWSPCCGVHAYSPCPLPQPLAISALLSNKCNGWAKRFTGMHIMGHLFHIIIRNLVYSAQYKK